MAPTRSIELQYILYNSTRSNIGRDLIGSTGRDRTYDQLVNSQLHYLCATVEHKTLRGLAILVPPNTKRKMCLGSTMVPDSGIEPLANALSRRCSTAELNGQNIINTHYKVLYPSVMSGKTHN